MYSKKLKMKENKTSGVFNEGNFNINLISIKLQKIKIINQKYRYEQEELITSVKTQIAQIKASCWFF